MAEFEYFNWAITLAVVAAGGAMVWYIDRVKDMRLARPIIPGEVLDRIEIDPDRAPEAILSEQVRVAMRVCIVCRHKKPCWRWLRGDGPADDYQAFCPNAAVFDQLRHEHRLPRDPKSPRGAMVSGKARHRHSVFSPELGQGKRNQAVGFLGKLTPRPENY